MTSLRRVVSVLFSPGKTFQEIGERPTWGVALVVLLVVAGISSTVVLSKIDLSSQESMIRDRLEERGMSGEELERAVEQAVTFTEKSKPFWPVAGLVFSVAFYLFAALLLWGGVTLAGGQARFVTALSTTLHGLMPQAVLALLTIPVALSQGTIDPETAQSGSILASNLAVFAPEDTGAGVLALLSSLDFFTIWSVILLIIGFSVTARVSKGASAAVVIGCWIIAIAVKAGLAALGS